MADLQLQYGSGAPTFYNMARNGGVTFDLQEAERIVRTWRKINNQIAAMWPDLHDTFRHMFSQKQSCAVDFRGRVEIGFDSHRNAGYVRAPTGLMMWYPDPAYGTNKKGQSGFGYKVKAGRSEWFELIRPTTSANNVIQFLARCATMEHAVILSDYASLRLVLSVHDENVFIVPDHAVDRAAQACNLSLIHI